MALRDYVTLMANTERERDDAISQVRSLYACNLLARVNQLSWLIDINMRINGYREWALGFYSSSQTKESLLQQRGLSSLCVPRTS